MTQYEVAHLLRPAFKSRSLAGKCGVSVATGTLKRIRHIRSVEPVALVHEIAITKLMCGIAGYFGVVDAGAASRSLRSMAATLAHRGPDGEGFFEAACQDGRRVGLAHRRLAIIDLSTGNQPMASADGMVQLTFNGEIYNFKTVRRELESEGAVFRTQSDTEVLLQAYLRYGVDCLAHLKGMFAFALWDGRHQRLWLARDRFGEKPLFYAETPHGFIFASEIKGLLAWPSIGHELDETALAHYLQYRYVPGPGTLFRGIRKLSPGCHAMVDASGIRIERYYHLPDARPAAASASYRPGDFLERLDASVALMMTSDVPYGAFLSGGIDSSAVVALMSRHGSVPVKTFSVGFSEPKFSELSYARDVATAFKTDHHELVVSHTDVAPMLPKLAAMRDAPVSEPADVPLHLLAKQAGKSVKMVLTGEGSDETLAGYPKHVAEARAHGYLRLPGIVRRFTGDTLAGMLPSGAAKAATMLRAMALERMEERMPRWFGALSPAQVAQFSGAWPVPLRGEARRPFEIAPRTRALRQVLHFDQASWLPDNLLERGDRMTMAASIEARLPFLDHELVEFVSGLPERARLRGLTGKFILRQAMQGVLPEKILKRRKVGFAMPIATWLRNGMREHLQDHLCGGDSWVRQRLNARAIDDAVEEHLAGRCNHEKLLWMLLNLEIWARAHDVR